MLTYGDITRDPSKLPEATLKALLQRGFAHVLGNEKSSKVVGQARKHIAGDDGKTEFVSKEAIQALRLASPELFNGWMATAIADALSAIDDGTLGTRTGGGGVRVDPVTAAMNSIARSEVTTTLKANGLKVPKGEETVEFANGAKKTMAAMVATRLEKNGERIRKEAEKQVADAARRRAKIEAEAKAAGTIGKDALTLGL